MDRRIPTVARKTLENSIRIEIRFSWGRRLPIA